MRCTHQNVNKAKHDSTALAAAVYLIWDEIPQAVNSAKSDTEKKKLLNY